MLNVWFLRSLLNSKKNADQDESGHSIGVAEKEAAYIMYKVCVI